MNGKADWIRWIAGIAMAVLLSWAALREEVAVVKTNEANHYAEVLRRLDAIDSNQREESEFRNEIRGIVRAADRGVDRRTGEPVLLQQSIDQGQR